MARLIASLVVLLAACAFDVAAEGRADGLKGCLALPECMALLDAVAPKSDRGPSFGDEREIADNLRRFGGAAKQELLRRAVGDHPGWRDLAGDILRYWGGWSPSDVPALRAALQLRHGGSIAWPLGETETPEAIQALVDDLVVIGPSSQTGGALERLGAPVLPYLLPLLEDERKVYYASVVIRGIGVEALESAEPWLALAESSAYPKGQRLAALRGLAAMGDPIQRYSERLHALRTDSDADIRDQALKTLIAIHDPSVAAVVAEKCNPSAAVLEAVPLHSVKCLWDVAEFGSNGRSAGPNLMRFLQSKNGAELATAIGVLGYIGYDDAIPAIRNSLRWHDWRVVQASIHSLGWLGATEAVSDIQQVAASYWLPSVGRQAEAVLDTLKSAQPKTTRPARFLMSENVPFGSYTYGERSLAAEQCPSRRWQWQGHPFSEPQSTGARGTRLTLDNGTLVGTDKGEWGGELEWMGKDGQTRLLIRDNVVSIQPADGGAMVLFGLAHMALVYGYAVHVKKGEDGNWSLNEAARLPQDAQALATIGPNLFAAWSGGRVVVFSDKGVLGLAPCIP
jgi:HEAT repeat protein